MSRGITGSLSNVCAVIFDDSIRFLVDEFKDENTKS